MSLAVFDVSKSVDPVTGEATMPVYKPLPGTVRCSHALLCIELVLIIFVLVHQSSNAL